MTVRNVKLFLDGVITAPALTGAMLQPYLDAQGTGADRHWVPGNEPRAGRVFPCAGFAQRLLIAVAGAGFEPHMHADGDRAVHEGLDGIEALRAQLPGQGHSRRHRP